MSDRRLRNRSKEAVFLCYHSIAAAGPEFLTIPREQFEQHLSAFAARGLDTGDLTALESIAEGRQSPATVFLTFDDGFVDNYETVLPILRERGLRAFVFVLPPLVDNGAPLAWPELREDSQRHPETMRSVTWSMLGEMKEEAFEVGSHTLSHAHLPGLGAEELKHELWESRARVKEALGACDTLAYPFGEWSPEVAAAAADCGYRFAFTLPTSTGQRAATPLSIPRVNVDYRDEGARLSSKLSRLGRWVRLSNEVKTTRRIAKRGIAGFGSR